MKKQILFLTIIFSTSTNGLAMFEKIAESNHDERELIAFIQKDRERTEREVLAQVKECKLRKQQRIKDDAFLASFDEYRLAKQQREKAQKKSNLSLDELSSACPFFCTYFGFRPWKYAYNLLNPNCYLLNYKRNKAYKELIAAKKIETDADRFHRSINNKNAKVLVKYTVELTE